MACRSTEARGTFCQVKYREARTLVNVNVTVEFQSGKDKNGLREVSGTVVKRLHRRVAPKQCATYS